MPKWENNILGFISEAEWLDVGFNVNRPNDPIDSLFGDTRTNNLVAKWQSIANEYQIPMMAHFHGFDTEANTTFRVPVDTHNIEKGLIKVKINQSERMRALLRSGVREDDLYDYVINDGVRLADQVFTRSKVAKNELLATGKVTITENNLNLSVDYGVPTTQTQYTLDLSHDADFGSQIRAIIDYAADKGITINGMVTSRRNITKMRQNAGIQRDINGDVGAGRLVQDSAFKSYMEEEFGISKIITNDLTYGASATIDSATNRPSITTRRYYPANKITFFATTPAGVLGTGLWGDPPEVDAGDFYKVNASGVSPYVYVMQWMEKDPAVLWTKASGLFMPVLYNPNSLFIATVADDFLDEVTISAADQSTDMWGTLVSSIQSAGTAVANGAVTGTLTKLTSGQLVNDWGEGYFLALKWGTLDTKANSFLIGLEPSAGTGLVEAYTDTDKWIVMKVTNKNEQRFKAVLSDGTHSRVQTYDLSGLTLS